MSKTTIPRLPDPSGCSADPFTDIIGDGARKLIGQVIQAKMATLMAALSDEKLEDVRGRQVCHGQLPEREVMCHCPAGDLAKPNLPRGGLGPVPIQVPRVRDRGDSAQKVWFTSTILLPHLRKAKSIEELLSWLYLKGISTGDFHEALAALLRLNAAGLSATTISRLTADWWDEYDRWQRRDLGTRRFVYIWSPSRDIAVQCPAGPWVVTTYAHEWLGKTMCSGVDLRG